MTRDDDVRAHYRHGSLGQALLAALIAAGKDPARLAPEDLAGADEFHIGGAKATQMLASQLALTPGMHLLDVGSGLGGPARHLAKAHDCRVTGVDLSDEYVEVATDLTRRMGLTDRVSFQQGSATALPFADATFDGATLLHVGMNIADKQALCAAVHRVLRPGGCFAVYDVMRTGPGEIEYPVPWASTAATSFVETPDAYHDALTSAGFRILAEQSRAEFALGFFAALRARQGQAGAPALGLPVIMGATAPQKIANMVKMLERGTIAPVEIIARRS